ncbi:MAG: lipid A 4'-phosphatase [Thalassolituus sp.]|jgi:lipid A 4'-phosphatase|tara:strand:- start:66 stop:725 length:660 start_codon:yes stop_codon:yes gene_type:complete
MWLFFRQHIDWISFLFFVILFVSVPSIDLAVSGLFYDHNTGEWAAKNSPVGDSIYGIFRYIPFFLVPVLLFTVISGFIPGGIDKSLRKIWVFLLVTLLAGPGILVHSVFKEGFDRARPKNVEQFDGRKTFTPAFVINDTCNKGCNSFVSGHAAMGFWFMTLGWMLGRRWFWSGVAVGVVLSISRITQGGHFLSDTLFAGYVCYFTFRILGWWILGKSRA